MVQIQPPQPWALGVNARAPITFSTHCFPLLPIRRARNLFVEILGEVRLRYQFAPVGLVVMQEHFHLLTSEPQAGTPSLGPQVLKQCVSRKLPQRRRKRDPSSQLRLCKESSNAGLRRFWLQGEFPQYTFIDDMWKVYR
jgi:hypothetical protein